VSAVGRLCGGDGKADQRRRGAGIESPLFGER
jgi:hypothetical protein